MTLTQKRALTFIRNYISTTGCSPTYDQIKDGLGLSSKGSTFALVKRLAAQHYIQFEDAPGHKIKISNVCCPACGAVLSRDELDRAA